MIRSFASAQSVQLLKTRLSLCLLLVPNELMSPAGTEADRIWSVPDWDGVCASSAWHGSVRGWPEVRSEMSWKGLEEGVLLADGVWIDWCLMPSGMQRRGQKKGFIEKIQDDRKDMIHQKWQTSEAETEQSDEEEPTETTPDWSHLSLHTW